MEISDKNSMNAKETARIESFSDGVFAIAITLLILDIRVPDVKDGETLLQSLATEWPGFLAFLIGFFTLLICWINHHFMFQYIHKSDSILLLLNGFKLLVVTTTPFATAILSKYIQTDWSSTAVILYCFNFALMGTAMMGIWIYATKKTYVSKSSPAFINASSRLYVFAGGLSTTIWIVSFFSLSLCLVLSAIMFLIFLFPRQSIEVQGAKF